MSFLIEQIYQTIGRTEAGIFGIFEIDLNKVKFALIIHDEKEIHLGVHVPIEISNRFSNLGFGECLDAV